MSMFKIIVVAIVVVIFVIFGFMAHKAEIVVANRAAQKLEENKSKTTNKNIKKNKND
jgi:phosphotransferase system  glucose/maltose/N-acetylglucosamine-specific IIC component